MKKLLLILFVLFSSLGFAAELTADSVAVEPSYASKALEYVMLGMCWLIARFGAKLTNALNLWLKGMMHFKGDAVVADAVSESTQIILEQTGKAMADGVITKDEREQIEALALKLAKSRLQNLAGFYKADLEAWVKERVAVNFAKLLSRA